MNKDYSEIVNIIDEAWQSGRYKDLAAQWFDSKEIISLLWERSQNTNKKIAWRSAYLMDLIHDRNPLIMEEYLVDLCSKVQLLDNESVKRHYLRIISQHDISDKADGYFVDACFKWLASEVTPIAVKAQCMTILYNLCHTYPELAPELKAALIDLLPYASKGESNKAKKILNQIEAFIQ